MRAGLRWSLVLLAGGPWLAPAPARGQETTQPATTTTPATDAIGPKELQNFSLPGRTTQPAEQPATTPSTDSPAARTEDSPAVAAATRSRPPARPASREAAVAPTATAQQLSAVEAAPRSPLDAPLPTVAQPPTAQPALSPAAAPLPAEPAGTFTPQHELWLLPWIAVALALAGATVFLLWRRRPREVFAGAKFDLFSAPESEPAPAPRAAPQPAPRPAPAPALKPSSPPRPAAPAAIGIVASRLRPSLEIGVKPLRCIVEDDQVAIEFEVDLFNAGTAPARAVLAEASLFNVGPNQEQELGAFFAKPVGAGNRIDSIPPLRRLTLTSQVVAPRGAIQEYALAGRKSFVPVIAFNALYEWSGGKGQTSAAYLVGRETAGDKLGPLRLDLGPRDVRGLGARTLPMELRL